MSPREDSQAGYCPQHPAVLALIQRKDAECSRNDERIKQLETSSDENKENHDRIWRALAVQAATVNKIIGVGLLASVLMPIITGLVVALVLKGLKP